MGESLQIDTDLAHTLASELAAIAEDAQQDLTRLHDTLDREGDCWGNDEPGRTFGDSYTPVAKKGLTGLQHLVDNLRSVSKGITEATDTIHNQDQDGGQQLRTLGQNSFGPTPEAGPSYDQPVQQQPAAAALTSNPANESVPNSDEVAGSSTPARSSAGPARLPGTAGLPVSAPDYSPSTTAEPQPNPVDPGGDSPELATPAADSPAPGNPAPRTAGQPAPQAVSGAPPAATPQAGGRSTGFGKSAETPWSGTAAEGSPTRNASGTPWSPSAPASSSPGRVFPPRHAPGPTPRKADRDRDRKPGKPKRVTVAGAPADAAALATARALADRHDLRLAGFDTVPLTDKTMRDMAAALDAILGKYPFLELAGIEITDLGENTVSRVVRDKARTERDEARAGPWILLDRKALTEPRILAENIRTTTHSGEPMPEFEQRPMYSTIVADLGRVLEAAAGAEPRRLAQRSLIAEYQRISGGWNGNETLSGVLGSYRRWRSQLSSRAFDDDRFQPRAALVSAFAEVELRGANAGEPARVLHRLVVEHARERSNTR
ncbi:hypothetical protein K7711_40190 [Nocardia sp. CA2R105]|uniref:hypothetical protein n=1 Tax=Nocardia coffeae TaxID=2873381 RepID=UPI001CA63434|nr:hypothetical protein [Nocardia coffeae]MBY8862745.1 hypothetical protein [Nocardia coffeae]